MEKDVYQRALDIFKKRCPKEFGSMILGQRKLEKLKDYLYYIEYYDWDYDLGSKYLKGRPIFDGASCSAVKSGSLYGRNFDWFYDETAEFVVRTKATGGRHASIGIAQCNTDLTAKFVDSGLWDSGYDILPFLTVDGINDHGVACNTNVVPTGDKGHTTGTNPSADKSYCTIMMVRYILDYADSAADAIEKIQNVNWFTTTNSKAADAGEVHCMVADEDSCYVVEFVNNELKIFSDVEDDDYDTIPNNDIITNFYLDGWNGSIVTGFNTEGGIDPEDTTLTPHAEGTERYEILLDGYSEVSTKADMLELMESAWYTQLGDETTNPYWYSELVGETETFGDLTIYDNSSEFAGIKEYVLEQFENRQRNGKTWHTVHTSVFDLHSKTMTVVTQEDNTVEFTFGAVNNSAIV